MQRLTNTLANLKISTEALSTNYANLQAVRWRKPRWLPVAKSKIFRVPTRYQTPEEEKIELRRLHNNYYTQIKSIRRYLTLKYCTRFLASMDPEQQKKIFVEDYNRCMDINNKWNEQQKILREQRVEAELQEQLDFAKKRIQVELIKKEEKLLKAEEMVRQQKEASKTFISPENLDAAIEHALANPIDFNFAIDVNGNKIIGRETKPPSENKRISAKQ